MDYKYSPPGNMPELVTDMFADLDHYDSATMQQFLYYLSSRQRAAGTAYAHMFADLDMNQRAEFLKIFYEEIVWHTTLFGFAATRFPKINPGEAHRELVTLLTVLKQGDPMQILAACKPSHGRVPDRILAHYECNWWRPFDPSKNWDASNVSFIARTFRHQRHFLLPLDPLPLPSNRLSDLSHKQLVACAESIEQCAILVKKDTQITAREIAKAVNMYCRWKALLVKSRIEEDRRRQKARLQGLAEHGLSPAVLQDILAWANQRKHVPGS
ncbi:hypothetical protein CC1G_15420 [Coprinopsis cinerea okayama7|uniref:Uncharacterized protein n=1 Tax=Coprinopsis cinerea (strain Okayama-7 / 130 / ATCC MYA-4618 / FGSC 9003) TaxID=240176 RepID=D6RQT5_COPC7|nr:hypothetical protein CC1G_15420 [Coprinopsis cinerea okayama7\|eukprot:XP_002910143.1 hypothetical protein CC1G_15420 [Coprinopsis cinerea okayama7\